ncbi:MAG TPA: hypothetical protein VFJ85_10130 [Acidimicrobiales bacterium]|nr:hypothetical protein [Acidimicrobiales bacterium]
MTDAPNLFRLLENDWVATASGPAARRACRAWAAADPVLSGLTSPAEVVARCQRRGDPAGSAALLGALLGQVGADPWPARTVLQAVLPGLAALSRRARPLVGPAGAWQGLDELDQQVVATAYERILALAPSPPPWPAMAIVDGTWQRLRAVARAECRRRDRTAEFDDSLAELAAPAAVSAAEELAGVLAEAVQRGVLAPLEGWLVLASRAQGRPMEELAASAGRNPRWAWRQRVRAERALLDAGPVLAAAS